MTITMGLDGLTDHIQPIKYIDDSVKNLMNLGSNLTLHGLEKYNGLQPRILKVISDLKEIRLELSDAEVWTTNEDSQQEEPSSQEDSQDCGVEGTEVDGMSMFGTLSRCGMSVFEGLELDRLDTEQIDLSFTAELNPSAAADVGEAAVIVLRTVREPEVVEEESEDDVIGLNEEVLGSPPGQMVPGSPVDGAIALIERQEVDELPKIQPKKPRGKDCALIKGKLETLEQIKARHAAALGQNVEEDLEVEPSCALPFMTRMTLGHNVKRFPLPGDKKRKPKADAECNQKLKATVYFLRPRKAAEGEPEAPAGVQAGAKKKDDAVAGSSKGVKASTKGKKTKTIAKEVVAEPESESDIDMEYDESSGLSRRAQRLLKKLKPCSVMLENWGFDIHVAGTAVGGQKSGIEAEKPAEIGAAKAILVDMTDEDPEPEVTGEEGEVLANDSGVGNCSMSEDDPDVTGVEVLATDSGVGVGNVDLTDVDPEVIGAEVEVVADNTGEENVDLADDEDAEATGSDLLEDDSGMDNGAGVGDLLDIDADGVTEEEVENGSGTRGAIDGHTTEDSGSEEDEAPPVVERRSLRPRRSCTIKKSEVEENETETFRIVVKPRNKCRYTFRKLKTVTTTTADREVLTKTTTLSKLSEPGSAPAHQQQNGRKPSRAPVVPKSTRTVREKLEQECGLNILKAMTNICNMKNTSAAAATLETAVSVTAQKPHSTRKRSSETASVTTQAPRSTRKRRFSPVVPMQKGHQKKTSNKCKVRSPDSAKEE